MSRRYFNQNFDDFVKMAKRDKNLAVPKSVKKESESEAKAEPTKTENDPLIILKVDRATLQRIERVVII
ncbi:hypothetical protein [Campylobacter gastrosuis]|uniref:Uncharacterized protein n=1 Tax=Campylobacter gastrosuis TaxID=2974576 RepID=A0ABT7HSY8_9BACT|nr:hypothetical protein [Campylobacter gastrosuis]MDL0090044.1 hypothetical protein [Campylobacter gastrosuis]